jgi:DNA-binding response OmpR family regulator
MPLDGKRVLIAEDEYLIGMDLARVLREAGATVIGPVAAYRDALEVIDEADLDAATVEVGLHGFGYRFMTVADALSARSSPFIFATSLLRAWEVPPRYAAVPRIEKPFAPGVVLRALESVMTAYTAAAGSSQA